MTTPARPQAQAQGQLDELLQLLADFDAAMLVTLDAAGRLHARPMGLQLQEKLSDCDLWLITADDPPTSRGPDELAQPDDINLCCLRTRDRAYVSIWARARVERDPALARRLWRDDWKIWFGDERAEGGAIAILKLAIERAEYWDPEGGRLRVLFAAAPEAGGDAGGPSPSRPKRLG
jgi:general stress protein 26